MNNSIVKSTLEEMFSREPEFDFRYDDVSDESAAVIKVYYIGQVYTDNYECIINITLESSLWHVDVNGFNTLKRVDSPEELKFAVAHQMGFSKFPCAEEKLYILNSANNDCENAHY